MHTASRMVSGFVAAAFATGLGTAVVATAAGAEPPDAGETVATAANAYGQTSITGTMATGDDVDLFTICISDGPTFGVTVGGLGAGSNDGQLFLFDATGVGKAGVDDTGAGGLVPAIAAGNAITSALPPGEYLLGVSNFDRDPTSATVEIFPSVAGVTGPNAGVGALDGWNGASNANAMTTYTLTLTGAACAKPSLAGVPADVTVVATSGAGATVSYATPTATDFLDQALTPSCAPASGSTFPIGQTTVTCSATDALAQTTTATFVVTVTNAAPSVTVPSDITVNATGASGAVVTFDASGSDPEEGALTPVCVPPSGSTFAITTTLVTCTVTDFGGLEASKEFNVTVLDNPPVLTVPSDLTANATSTSGAPVGFTVTATDVEDGTLTPVCTPASGSSFPIGTTEVACSVTDSAKHAVRATFNVTVVNTPPVVSVPANLTVTATSPSGALVTFAATAVDPQEGALTPVCTPASGSTFAIGTATVSCTATDTAGLADTETFTVTVTAQPTADVQVAKTGSVARGVPGDPVVYTIRVTNNGPATAERVVVTDPLPAGLTVSSAGGEGFACVVTGSTVRCTRPTLASGATATVTINAVIATGVTAGQRLTNVATVATATLDPTSTNDSASQVLEIAPLPPTGAQALPMTLVGLAVLLLGGALVVVGLRRPS